MSNKKTNLKAIWLIGFAMLLVSIQLYTINTYILIYLRDDLLTAIIIITILLSLRNFLQLFIRVPLGEVSQIIGRKPLMLSGHFSFTLAIILMFLANDWIFILFAVILVAWGMSCFWPSLFGLIADLTPNSIGETNGRIFQMSDAGTILASFISVIILNGLLWDLKYLFLLIGSFGVVTGFISIILLPEGLKKDQRKQVPNIWRAIIEAFTTMIKSLKTISNEARLADVYIFQLILAFLEYSLTIFLPALYLLKGFSEGDVSAITFTAIIIVFWFKPYLGKIVDKLDFNITMTSSLVFSGILMLIYVYTTNFWTFVVLTMLTNASLITAYTACNAETSHRAAFESRGIALGALGFYISLGRTTSTLVLGVIWDIFGLIELFFFSTLIVVLASVILFFNIKRHNHNSSSSLML